MRRWLAALSPACGVARAVAIGAILLGVNLSRAQSSTMFEVATIKASGEDSAPFGINRTPGQFAASNSPLAFLIKWAYDLDDGRLIGSTRALESARFDILAKIPNRELAPGELRLMMQALLAERFTLRIHKETRELSSYTLVTDGGGAKLHFVEAEGGFGQNPFQMTDRGRIVGTKVTTDMLAKVLAAQVGRPVEDLTGIKRPFDFTLEWTPDGDSTPGAQQGLADGRNRPSILTAIREQLGLRMESRK